MKLMVYSMLDAKAGVFSNPFFVLNDEVALREISDAVNFVDPKNQWNSHAEDFALYRIGEYDSVTGELIAEKVLKCIVSAAALKKTQPVPIDILGSRNGVEKTPVA